jgi:hypothetical protein
MNEEPSIAVSDDVALGNTPPEPNEDATQVLAARLGEVSLILDVLVEAIDDRDRLINDLLQRVSDLEQVAALRPS